MDVKTMLLNGDLEEDLYDETICFLNKGPKAPCVKVA